MSWYGTDSPGRGELRVIEIVPRSRRNADAQDEPIGLFCNNEVVTAKYSIISFLPIALFEQFRRLANMYFLFIVILMLIGKGIKLCSIWSLSLTTTDCRHVHDIV